MQNLITVMLVWRDKKLWGFIAKCLLFTLGINVVMGFVLWSLHTLEVFAVSSGGPARANDLGVSVFLYCILFPIAETFVFQHIPYMFMQSRKRTIVLSACFFGICHLYDPAYFLTAFVIGGVFMSAYIRWDSKPNRFIVIALVHALHNFITIVGMQLFELNVFR